MDREQLKQIIDSPDEYDEGKEETYGAYAKYFFKHSQPWILLLVFGHFFFCWGLAVVCGILFAYTDSTKLQIMYAALFVCLIIIGYLIKVFGWVMGVKLLTRREIKRLELRIVELSEAIQS
ncbi:DUF6768 family protein [Planctomycetota bacterium]